MIQYIVRRLLWAVVILVAVIAITFLIFNVLPSVNPAILLAGKNASPRIIKYREVSLGLNKPIYTQFWVYLKGVVLHFNLGFSYYSGASVRSLIANRLPATISLTVGAVVIWVISGVGVGIISAVRRGTFLDRAAMGTALVFVSAPVYWLGLLALFAFASDIGRFHLFPGSGSYVGLTYDPWQWFTSLLMPWFVLAASFSAIYARVLRGSLITTMSEDYIRTARAKGLSERRVVLRHGLRGAATPLVTILGLDIGTLLGGAVLVETVFNVPGIGRLNFDAINHSDYPIVQGTVLLAALFIVLANLVVDIAYAYLDPRVRFS